MLESKPAGSMIGMWRGLPPPAASMSPMRGPIIIPRRSAGPGPPPEPEGGGGKPRAANIEADGLEAAGKEKVCSPSPESLSSSPSPPSSPPPSNTPASSPAPELPDCRPKDTRMECSAKFRVAFVELFLSTGQVSFPLVFLIFFKQERPETECVEGEGLRVTRAANHGCQNRE